MGEQGVGLLPPVHPAVVNGVGGVFGIVAVIPIQLGHAAGVPLGPMAHLNQPGLGDLGGQQPVFHRGIGPGEQDGPLGQAGV